MITISKPGIRYLKEYSQHLKQLPEQDKISRFGYKAGDYAVDQLMLRLAYDHKDHELWQAVDGDEIVGWGHMARDHNDVWELAVSVSHDHQRKGIGDRLIAEMLAWAKFHQIDEVFMHCIEENRVIQHLAQKHGLKTRERAAGERTAAIEVPLPSFMEANSQLWKEHSEIMDEYARLRTRLQDLWFKWPK